LQFFRENIPLEGGWGWGPTADSSLYGFRLRFPLQWVAGRFCLVVVPCWDSPDVGPILVFPVRPTAGGRLLKRFPSRGSAGRSQLEAVPWTGTPEVDPLEGVQCSGLMYWAAEGGQLENNRWRRDHDWPTGGGLMMGPLEGSPCGCPLSGSTGRVHCSVQCMETDEGCQVERFPWICYPGVVPKEGIPWRWSHVACSQDGPLDMVAGGSVGERHCRCLVGVPWQFHIRDRSISVVDTNALIRARCRAINVLIMLMCGTDRWLPLCSL
jgi:hypothetical protein